MGVSYQPVPMRGVIGFGFNWGRPNQTSFGDLNDQYTTELFWRYQLTKELAVTPSIQSINNPALNDDEDNLWAFALQNQSGFLTSKDDYIFKKHPSEL